METSRTENSPILVIGSTGKTGRRVAERLTAKGANVRSGSRNAEIPFDWDRQETWAHALAGTRAAYITYYPDLAFPGASDLIAAFCRVAVEHGVQRLVLLSGRECGYRADHPVRVGLAAGVSRHARRSGPPRGLRRAVQHDPRRA
ncbi:nucleoside-diphosphate-sugar epimerase [Arthrobacter pigmenti]|uniref:Nucleoside-diphosphate-sugar epimerase n=1 Tax=Arthrobacter pigmenti TaxID=271432 RepID=A0A846RLA2_9MICC|nr:NAD(P)H-binding protein [Arthrobacter pigmenti]NJC24158.1 nucleoside-diphosphate-sugar epimerase [Arthrobacter pigmenti]